MKTTSVQIAKQIINDNNQYINGNIAEYMIKEVDSDDNNFFQFLTDEEIEDMDGNQEKWNKFGEEVYSMLKEIFNYDISEFKY